MADRPSSPDPSSAGSANSAPPGLGEQFGRTRSAFLGLVSAHVKLAQAEFGEIGGEIKRAAALGGIALALLLFTGTLAIVGTTLFAGEALFGSIGWGLLLGVELFLAVAVTLVLLILPESAPRVGWAGFVAFVAAAVFGLFLWLQLTSRAWGWVGSTFFGNLTWFDGHLVSSADRPIAAGVIVLALFLGVLGALMGLLIGSGFVGRLGAALGAGLVAAIVGGLLGAMLGLPMSWVCSIAVALALFLILVPALGAVFVLPRIELDKLKARFLPNETIATTKETIEWVREQMPLGRKS